MQYFARAIFSFLLIAATNVSADGDFLLEEVTIIGDRDGARTLLGSAALVDSGQVRNEALVDINKILKQFQAYIFKRKTDMAFARILVFAELPLSVLRRLVCSKTE